MLHYATLILLVFSIVSCAPTKELSTVTSVDLNKYAGTWYEIARLPNSFEKGLDCITATYSIKKNGKVEVLNKGHLSKNKSKTKDIKGTAWVPDANYPGRLKVRFFWPFAGDYYIIALDEDYQYALVGDPSREYLWILSREPNLNEATFSKLSSIAKENGFDITPLIKVKHDCN